MIIIRVLADDVIQYHVWRALRVDPQWGEDCQETSLLVGYYWQKRIAIRRFAGRRHDQRYLAGS